MAQIQKDNTAAQFPVGLPPLPASGVELYDSIMQRIEPELVSAELPNVRKRLQNAKPETLKMQAKKYLAAFGKFQEILALSEKRMSEEVRVFAHTTYAALEKIAASIDADVIVSLEKEFARTEDVKQKTPEDILAEETAPPAPNVL